MFFWNSCFFHDPADAGNLISGSSAFSKSSLNIRKFTVHILLNPDLENFEHYFASMWDEWNCVVFWVLFGIAFLWDWNENWTFPVLWPLLSFPNLLAYWLQYFHSIIFKIWNNSIVLLLKSIGEPVGHKLRKDFCATILRQNSLFSGKFIFGFKVFSWLN